jgi:hypothetical protein
LAFENYARGIAGPDPDEALPIWTHLRFDEKQVTRIWPGDNVPQTKRALGGARERKLRDFHSALEAAIRRNWPKAKPSLNKMADQLGRDPMLKLFDYSYDTIRKMLQNSYAPFLELGLTVSTSSTRS